MYVVMSSSFSIRRFQNFTKLGFLCSRFGFVLFSKVTGSTFDLNERIFLTASESFTLNRTNIEYAERTLARSIIFVSCQDHGRLSTKIQTSCLEQNKLVKIDIQIKHQQHQHLFTNQSTPSPT
jgi:hypothetical protein